MSNRRQFITLLGGAAAWPVTARAQQPGVVRRIGFLWGGAESDPDGPVAVFRAALQELGWTEGRNIRIDVRWTAADSNLIRAYAAELVGLTPDVIFAQPHPAVVELQQHTRTIPIVAMGSGDLVDAGLAQSYSRPSGNLTGFMTFEATINAKFLQLLKDIAPHVSRVAVIQTAGSVWRGDIREIEAVARSFAVHPIGMIVRDTTDIERTIASFASEPNGGLICPPDSVTTSHRDLIVALAAKHRLPAVYSSRAWITSGGLMFYGVNQFDIYRRAAGYVDRILRGEKPGELPIQAPTKFDLGINLKTARALGLDVSPPLLIRADEVIE
jgi:putative tryptophan/tyrosine transport system substrate-binding protein